jgi:hypothetical protein
VICLCISTKLNTQANMIPKEMYKLTDVIKRERRKTNIPTLTEVLGETKKTGKHKFKQSTFRLDDDTRKKLEIMTDKLSANQVDVITFALKQFYTLFEDTDTVNKIHMVIERKLRRKPKN